MDLNPREVNILSVNKILEKINDFFTISSKKFQVTSYIVFLKRNIYI